MAILLTFHLLLAGTLVWVGVSAFRQLAAERDIFREFGQRGGLQLAVLLYPVAPVGLIIGLVSRQPVLGALLAVACLLPGLVLSIRANRRFETSGTDRTKRAAAAASLASTGALTGLIYVSLIVGLQAVTMYLMARNV